MTYRAEIKYVTHKTSIYMITKSFRLTGDYGQKFKKAAFAMCAALTLGLTAHSQCENHRIFLADNLENDITDIYEVNIEDGNANLTLIASSEIEVHIAFNEMDNLIYAVNKADGSYQTLDPNANTPEFGLTQNLNIEVSGIVTATFTPDGALLIGSMNSDVIYSVNVVTNEATVYDGYAPIEGGDIAFDNEGMLYLATNTGSGLYQVYPDGVVDDILIGSVPSQTTGIALLNENQLLLSHKGSNSLKVKNTDGSNAETSYPLLLDGQEFECYYGDMASGCDSSPNSEENECSNFEAFYVQHGNGVSGSDLYRLSIEDGDAVLEHLTNVDFQAHIAYNGDENLVYLVNANGNFIRVYDPANGTVIGDLPIDADIDQLYAVVYNPEENNLLLGDANSDEIFAVDLTLGTAELVAEAPIQGGDLAIQNGEILLATRSGNKLYRIEDGGATLLGDIEPNVNGLAHANDGESLIMTNSGSSMVLKINANTGAVTSTFPTVLDGESFELLNGDLASGCNTGNAFTSCEYELYYAHQPLNGPNTFYGVELNNDGTADLTVIADGIGGHIGLSPNGEELYIVGGSNLRVFDLALGSIVYSVNIQTLEGQNLSGFPTCVVDDDGTIYAAGGGQVYAIALDGTAIPYGPPRQVSGGDLVIAEGELWIITRGNNKITNVLTGDHAELPAEEINGAAILPNGNLLVADGNQESLMKEIDLSTMEVVNTYDTGLELHNGDLAGRCVSEVEDRVDPGACFASEAIEYSPGLTMGDGALNANRTDPTQATGEPERIDQLVFTTLGYGGSITLGFDGPVLNGLGSDLEVVETSYNNPGCDAYPEFADVHVSVDGVNYFYAGTVCKGAAFIDIDDAGPFDYINYVRISSNDLLTSSGDGFDLDGVVAIHNCDQDELQEAGTIVSNSLNDGTSTLTSFPNPTTGNSQVVFVAGETGKTVLEVYDMNGRNVETLFDRVANGGMEYRVDFNGSSLPNGIYIYRLTTENETTIDKFMITR